MENANRINYGSYNGVRRVDHRREREPRFKNLKKKIIIVLAVAFLAFIGVRMATMEANLELRTTFEVPEGVSLSEIGADVSGVKWATAVDGKVTNENTEVQPTASTTKMILALAVMEKKPFSDGKGETITVTQEMYDIWGWYLNHNGSNTKVKVGEEISEYDALTSIMLASSNNMADSLAIWAFGSIEEYQKYATEMLARMEIKNTKLGTKDASGYDESTVSTASDLARIGYFVMKNPVLAEIVAKKEAEVPVAGKIKNTNSLLGKADISGVKTGYIGDESGYCIISGYKKDENIITVAVLGAKTRDGSFNNNLTVVKELQEKLVEQEMIKRDDEIGYYDSWWTGKVSLVADEELSKINYKGAETEVGFTNNPKYTMELCGGDGCKKQNEVLRVKIGGSEYYVKAQKVNFSEKPSLIERFLHVFGWKK